MFFFQLLIYLSGLQLSPGGLADTDCYMRLIRAQELGSTHAWFDQTIARSNSPFGESSHWGRLLDLLILALALPFSLFLSERQSLLYSGILISPLLLVLSGFAVAWSARPLLQNNSRIQLPHLLLLFYSQASVVLFFQAGRPDHHSLLLLLFIITLGFLFRLLAEGGLNGFTAITCALVQALAFSVSLESVTVILLSLTLLALAWIQGSLRPMTGLLFSGALTLGSLVFFLLEQGWSRVGTVELDRMSLPHLLALALATGYWLLAEAVERFQASDIPPKRAVLRMAIKSVFTCLYGILSGFLLFRLFPELLRGPYGQMEPRLNSLWLKQVLEVQPLWQTEPGGWASVFIWFIPGFLVLAALLYVAWRKKLRPLYLDRYVTGPWLAVALASLFFTFLTFYQIRWVSYAQTALIFALAAVLGELLEALEKKLSPVAFRRSRLAILFFFCAGYVPITAISLGPKILSSKKVENTAISIEKSGTLRSVTGWMNQNPEFSKRERILAHLDSGPELLYRTPHEVIATPYHRNGSGILFLYDLMNESSDEKVLLKLRERGITLILLKPESSEKAFLNQSGLVGTFYQRLVEGHCPAFLKPLDIPAPDGNGFRLYRVLRE